MSCEMTADLFESTFGAVMGAAGVRFFEPREVCRVGRAAGSVRLTAPPTRLWRNILPTLVVADWLREQTGAPIIVNSGYRSPEYNKAIGGAPASLHMEFNALDIRSTRISPEALGRLAHAHPYSQNMAVLLYASFVHIDTRGMIGRPAPVRLPNDGWWKNPPPAMQAAA